MLTAVTNPTPRLSQLTTQVFSIGSPAQSFDAQFDRRSNRASERSHLEALGDLQTVLRDGLPIDCRDDVVNTAIVFRNRKGRVQPAARRPPEIFQGTRTRVSISFHGRNNNFR